MHEVTITSNFFRILTQTESQKLCRNPPRLQHQARSAETSEPHGLNKHWILGLSAVGRPLLASLDYILKVPINHGYTPLLAQISNVLPYLVRVIVMS